MLTFCVFGTVVFPALSTQVSENVCSVLVEGRPNVKLVCPVQFQVPLAGYEHVQLLTPLTASLTVHVIVNVKLVQSYVGAATDNAGGVESAVKLHELTPMLPAASRALTANV